MKTKLLLSAVCCLLFLSGCTTPQDNPIHSVGVTTGANAAGDYNVGLTVTFKQVPSPALQTWLESRRSGIEKDAGGLTYRIVPLSPNTPGDTEIADWIQREGGQIERSK